MVLKKMVMGNFETEKVDGEIIEAIDFMVERVSHVLNTIPLLNLN